MKIFTTVDKKYSVNVYDDIADVCTLYHERGLIGRTLNVEATKESIKQELDTYGNMSVVCHYHHEMVVNIKAFISPQ